MADGGLTLTSPWWLLGLALPPLVWLLWRRLPTRPTTAERWRDYADAHLLPHLLVGTGGAGDRRRRVWLWGLLWCLLVLALAGPRWGYHEVRSYSPGMQLVVLLDLSASMNVEDVRPSRLARARQELEDLVDAEPGLRLGLIAFATVPHVVVPVTDDAETLRHLLPSLNPELVRMPGSRLGPALLRARQLLSGQSAEAGRAVLLLSDGDFQEPGLDQEAAKLKADGIALHVLGLGTAEGGPVPRPDGKDVLRTANGQPVVSPLDEPGLRRLAELGGGLYQTADYRAEDTQALVARLRDSGKPKALERGVQRVWEERYYLPVGLMLLLLLPWFRRNRLRAL